MIALYQADVTGRDPAQLVEPAAQPFTRELVDGVQEHRDELDALIERHSVGWSLDRIAPLERNILRVALHEMLHRPDVPAEVAIDEAVESAKEFASIEAPGFVNGILGAVQREQEAPAR